MFFQTLQLIGLLFVIGFWQPWIWSIAGPLAAWLFAVVLRTTLFSNP